MGYIRQHSNSVLFPDKPYKQDACGTLGESDVHINHIRSTRQFGSFIHDPDIFDIGMEVHVITTLAHIHS